MGGDHLWDAIGAVGEVLGALAVVATLIYLSKQLRQNSQQIRLNSSQIAHQNYSSNIREVLSDPELLPLFRKGLNDYSSLSTEDQARFHAVMLGFHVSYSQNAQLREEGIISDDTFIGWQNDWIRILKCRGSQQWWQWMQVMMGSDAASSVNELVSSSDQPPLNEVVPFLKHADG